MHNNVLKAAALLVALGLFLILGVLAGGSIVYVLAHANSVLPANVESVLPLAKAQSSDPGYGVVVVAVDPNGPAAQAGLVRGDILLEINGNQVEGVAALTSALANLNAGDQVELTVLHGDNQQTLTATLASQNGRAYLGITPSGGSSAGTLAPGLTSGALITSVVPGSPAAQANLQQGDEILSVDGQALDMDHSLSDLITSHRPGDRVALEVMRNSGETATINVVLGQNPENAGQAYLGVQYSVAPRFRLPGGGSIPLPNTGDYQFHQMPFVPSEGDWQQGALIRSVVPNSPAAAAGLHAGDAITAIDGTPLASPQALSEAVSAHNPGDRITLTVYQSNDQQEVPIDVTLGSNPDQAGQAYLGVSVAGYFRIQEPGEDGGSGGFLFGQPFDWPFGQDGAPFPFQLPSPPDSNGCNGSPACIGKSA